MIEKLILRNFKAIENASIFLSRINVLIGPNGTGKSSVLQFLTLMKQSLGQSSLKSSDGALNLGNYEDIVHKRDTERLLGLQLEAQTSVIKLPGRSAETTAVFYESEFDSSGLLGHRAVLQHENTHENTIEGAWHRVAGSKVEPSTIQCFPGQSARLGTSGVVGEPFVIEGFSAAAGQQVDKTVRTTLYHYFDTIRRILSGVYVVPQIRGFEAPAYSLQPKPVEDFFAVTGTAEQASRVLSTLAYRRELESVVSEFSRRALGVGMRIRLIPDKMVAAEASDGGDMNLVNEGFGANQLLVLLAQLVVAPEDSLIGIEEPEIHLHPKAQAALADIFTELVSSERKQLILATHSEHVLMGLLTQVARGRLRPEDLCVYYFQKDEQGVARPELLPVDDRGQLEGGLKGFFEANVEELEAFLEAVSRGKRR